MGERATGRLRGSRGSQGAGDARGLVAVEAEVIVENVIGHEIARCQGDRCDRGEGGDLVGGEQAASSASKPLLQVVQDIMVEQVVRRVEHAFGTEAVDQVLAVERLERGGGELGCSRRSSAARAIRPSIARDHDVEGACQHAGSGEGQPDGARAEGGPVDGDHATLVLQYVMIAGIIITCLPGKLIPLIGCIRAGTCGGLDVWSWATEPPSVDDHRRVRPCRARAAAVMVAGGPGRGADGGIVPRTRARPIWAPCVRTACSCRSRLWPVLRRLSLGASAYSLSMRVAADPRCGRTRIPGR